MLKVRVCMKRESKDVETDGRKKKKETLKRKDKSEADVIGGVSCK